MNHSSRIFVAGHNGLVGSAIIRKLKKKNVFPKTVSSAGIVQYQQHQDQGARDYPECHFDERNKKSMGPG